MSAKLREHDQVPQQTAAGSAGTGSSSVSAQMRELRDEGQRILDDVLSVDSRQFLAQNRQHGGQ